MILRTGRLLYLAWLILTINSQFIPRQAFFEKIYQMNYCQIKELLDQFLVDIPLKINELRKEIEIMENVYSRLQGKLYFIFSCSFHIYLLFTRIFDSKA